MIALEVQSQFSSKDRLQFLASSVPVGQRGLIHIWGRNDTLVEQKIGIYWVVKDPAGNTVEEYSDWKGWPTPSELAPKAEHEFIGGRFDLNKVGTYTLKANLLMGSPDSPEIVDSYDGVLCIVTTELPPLVPPVEEKGIPWGTIALMGGGLALAVALAKPKATERKK